MALVFFKLRQPNLISACFFLQALKQVPPPPFLPRFTYLNFIINCREAKKLFCAYKPKSRKSFRRNIN